MFLIKRSNTICFALLVLTSLTFSCNPLPDLIPRTWTKYQEIKVSEDSISFTIEKLIPGDISAYYSSTEAEIDQQLQPLNPLVFSDSTPVKSFTIYKPNLDSATIRSGLKGHLSYGDPNKVNTQDTLSWPFPKGKKVKIIQAYNGKFSHQEENSRYAIDFYLSIGDTVCAANDGLVVEVIQGYDIGGQRKKYRPYANFITLLHPDGYITQYVHLLQNGSLVKAGQEVRRGQAIGLSGNTGFSGGPHLHFNVYKPLQGKVISTPAWFEKGAGKSLRKGQFVTH